MSIRTFCDICGQQMTRNMAIVTERLIVNSHDFVAEVVVSKNGKDNDGDLCLDCLLKMINERPKRKYERKLRAATNQPLVEISTCSELAEPTPEATASPDITTAQSGEPLGFSPDIISTFSVVTGQDGKLHTLKMGDTSLATLTLKAGVRDLLGLNRLTEKDIEKAPESEGKRLLLDIFNPSKA